MSYTVLTLCMFRSLTWSVVEAKRKLSTEFDLFLNEMHLRSSWRMPIPKTLPPHRQVGLGRAVAKQLSLFAWQGGTDGSA